MYLEIANYTITFVESAYGAYTTPIGTVAIDFPYVYTYIKPEQHNCMVFPTIFVTMIQ